ncbi:unnamed protein product [Paramecium primaurelia]|uniref:Uncharacterized protein n=1 Tax=Paramecium primaurelia TaxID=5886 RepID=A0A8S1LCM3_PARPR|nr:unnamed protein product [Paramecium primaurelia]
MGLFLVSHQEQLLKVDQCTCRQILSLYDCNQLNKCNWNNEDGFCEDRKYADIDSYCSINSTNCPTNGCALYSGICKPFSGCSVYNAKTHDECQKISRLCTTNGEHCINVELLCDNFNDNQLACQIDLNGYPCYWNNENKKCYQIQACKEIPVSYKTHQTCFEKGQQSLLKCTAKQGGGCMDITQDCSGLQKEGCEINLEGKTCFWDGTSCKEYICENAPTSISTHFECQSFLSTCTLNAERKGCMEIAQECEIYISEPQCIQTKETICFWYSVTCKDGDSNCQQKQECKSWKCENAEPKYNSDTLCRQFKSECTVNNTNNGCIQRLQQCSEYQTQQQCVSVLNDKQTCYWNGNKCVDKICDNAVLLKYNETSCSRYMSQCTVGNNKCILKTCNTFLSENLCSHDYQNNKCSWSGYCTQKTCDNASDELITHAECQQWLDTCTIKSDHKGCQNISHTCDSYKIQDQCYLAGNPKFQCLWLNEQCVQKSCSTASLDINNDDECLSYLSTCMISDKKRGCVNRKATCLELLQHQCSITSDGQQCFWNGTQCINRKCNQGVFNSYQSCKLFLPICTVNSDGIEYKGCINQSEKCSQYTNELMCIESLNQGKCIWNKKALQETCEVRSCQNSDQTTSDEACSNFLSYCTVNSDKTECIQRYEKCNEYLFAVNCIKTKSNKECIWFNNSCTDRTCDKADKTFTTHEQCQQFSKNCTTNGKGCIQIDQCTTYTTRSGCVIDSNNQLCTFQPRCNLQQCSDAPQQYSTDTQCRTFKKECTTNGNGCVLRTQCIDAYIEQACVTDSNGNKCQWINNQCLDYNCSSAPINYVTELECHMYKPGCTTKQTGGCIIKGLCKDAKVQESCTTNKYGKQCIFSKDGCKDADCSDIPYKNHYDCAQYDPSCTSNGLTCIPQSKCNTKIQSGCFLGSDGPCLWVKNTCYQYSSCTSLQFQTHEQCYEFSHECTTDGNTCIPIDKCYSLPAQGCFQGTDGKCVYISEKQTCILFTGCNSIEYKTHEECQSLNQNCTTDETKCIELQDCSSYTKISNCYINSNKQKCYYDEQAKKCGDLQCSHLQFTTHDECNSLLKTCTSDNTKCIKIDNCETYDQNYCNFALGLDGKCKYYSNDTKCRPVKCNEQMEDCSQISNCVDSGLGCVDYSTCDKYETEKACRYGGSDGYCVWYLDNGKGKCKIMTKCSDASSDKEACQFKSQTCQWTQTSTHSSCSEYTCSSKKQKTEKCQAILDFSGQHYELCALSNGYCFSEKLEQLGPSNCFSATAYTYTWDSVKSVCLQCGTQYQNDTEEENNLTNSNDQETNDKDQVLFPMLSLIISIYI